MQREVLGTQLTADSFIGELAGGQFKLSAVKPIGAFVLLVFSCASFPSPRTFLERAPSADIRLLTWNIGADSIFGEVDHPTPQRPEGFRRVMQALQPDVMCLEEVASHLHETGALLDDVLPLRGAKWHTYGAYDVVIASRWPLRMPSSRVLEAAPRKRAHAVALVDVPGSRDLYVVCTHHQSRAGEENVGFRQLQSDIIASWLRDARTAGGAIDLPSNTPIVIAGDFNAVPSDPGNHLRTLLTGDISNETSFGPDAAPDWDGTELTDLLPLQNGAGPESWTWRFDAEGFAPSTLDRIVYSDSVLRADNAFVLNTRTMNPADLAASGLQPDDVLRDPRTDFYDHLPVVVDFALR